MRKLRSTWMAAALAGATAACATMMAPMAPTALFDGETLDGWYPVGDANWSVQDGEIVATEGSLGSFLVTDEDYDDFRLTLEFWAQPDGNSGIYFRCGDRDNIVDTTCYEANIYDQRADQTGRTGAIVHLAAPMVLINAGGRWNTYEITADGEHLTVALNGFVTVDVMDDAHDAGPIGLQFGTGRVAFRNVTIERL